jgi:hypothetical protein
MSTFDIFLRIALWFIIGTWVAYKRNWYKHISEDRDMLVGITIIFGPVSLFIAFVANMLCKKWDNEF